MSYRLLILLLLCQSCRSQAQTLQGKAVGISDGDSFTLLTDEKQQI